MEPKPRPPRPAAFRTAIEALCERYGFADWAIVAVAVDGSRKAWWVAGDGKNPVGDDDRAGVLHFEMSKLQATILAKSIEPTPAPKPKPPPLPPKS